MRTVEPVIALRPYQTAILDQARAAMRRGVRSLILEAPTGSGKTLLTAHMLKTAQTKRMTCWFLMHRAELLDQATRAFLNVDVQFGIVASGHTLDRHQTIQLCSINTLRRRMNRLPAPNLIVYDESHHVASRTWADIHAAYPQAFHVGLTATPERLDGKGLGTYFAEMIRGPEVRWLIENGFLSDYRLVVPPGGVSAEGIHRQMGDFNRHELAAAASGPKITGNAIREYLRYAKGKRAIARTVNIELSKELAAAFVASGIPALHIDGKTPRNERREAMESFRTGKTLVLSNVDLFSEGLDCPGVEAVLDLRPTESLTMCLQFWGRALRPAAGKDRAVLVDLAGNFQRHGLPCEVREWSLEGRSKKKKSAATILTVQCPKCYAVLLGRPPKCPECGHLFLAGEGRTVEQVEGELVEANVEAIRAAKMAKKREQSDAKTLAQLIALGEARKYKSPIGWAQFVYRSRHGEAATIAAFTAMRQARAAKA